MPRPKLRIPAVLAFTVSAAIGCGDDGKPTVTSDARCERYCVYDRADNGNCPFPTCATGSDADQCPSGCIPEPIA